MGLRSFLRLVFVLLNVLCSAILIVAVLSAADIRFPRLCQFVQEKSARFEQDISVRISFYCVLRYVYEEDC